MLYWEDDGLLTPECLRGASPGVRAIELTDGDSHGDTRVPVQRVPVQSRLRRKNSPRSSLNPKEHPCEFMHRITLQYCSERQ